MPGDLNMKKSWHPMLRQNQEKVWKKEKEAYEERKKLDELRRERDQEREMQELQRLQEEAGGKKRVDKVDWMYATPAAGNGPSASELEDYLLGKKRVDQFLQQKAKEQNQAQQEKQQESFMALQQSSGSANDIAAKIREDPMFAIRQQEQAAYQALLKDPARLRQMKAAAGMDVGKEDKEERRRRKEEKRRRHEERAADRDDRRDGKVPSSSHRHRDDHRSRAYDDGRESYRSSHHDTQRPYSTRDDRRDSYLRRDEYDDRYRHRSPPRRRNDDDDDYEYRRRSERSDYPQTAQRWDRGEDPLSDHPSRNGHGHSRARSPPRRDDRRRSPARSRSPPPPRRGEEETSTSTLSAHEASLRSSLLSRRPPSSTQPKQQHETDAPRSHNGNEEEAKSDRAAKLARMQSNAASLNASRSSYLCSIRAEEEAELAAEEAAKKLNRERNGRSAVAAETKGGFMLDQARTIGENGLEDRLKRGRGGLQRFNED